MTDVFNASLGLTQKSNGSLDDGIHGSLALYHRVNGSLPLDDGINGSFALDHKINGSLALGDRIKGSFALDDWINGSLAIDERTNGSFALHERINGSSTLLESILGAHWESIVLQANLLMILLETMTKGMFYLSKSLYFIRKQTRPVSGQPAKSEMDSILVFSRGQATLHLAVSVGPSV